MADTFEQWARTFYINNVTLASMSLSDQEWQLLSECWKASQKAILCECGEKLRKDCPESWEPGCDLGNNERFVSVWKGK